MKNMSKFITFVILLFITCGFVGQDSYRYIENESFTTGEVLEYRVHYGFINAGEATIEVSPTLHKVNNRVCYKVTASGRTVGAFDLVLRIRDVWRSYIDTAAFVPQRFYSNIQEGKYRKEETVFFNHQKHVVRSEEVNHETKEFSIPANIQDIVSGYYYLRTINFDKVQVGELITVKAFFDDEFYDFKVRYRGKEEIKTKMGKIKAIVINPVMPSNQLFDGENSIRVWISDDANKVPVKVEADMFVGAVEIDLKKYKGLRNKIGFY